MKGHDISQNVFLISMRTSILNNFAKGKTRFAIECLQSCT